MSDYRYAYAGIPNISRRAALSAICGCAGVVLIGHINILGNGNDGDAIFLDRAAVARHVARDGQGPHLGRHLSLSETSTSEQRGEQPTARRPRKRIAVVRPFGPDAAAELTASFDSWDPFWPCTTSSGRNSEPEYGVDLFLSFSRRYGADMDLYPNAVRAMSDLQTKFDSNRGWYGCFDNLYHIEADIPPHMDLYSRNHVQLDRDWVNGPNQQFRSIMEAVTLRNNADTNFVYGRNNDADEEESNGKAGEYELVLLLEPDARVQTVGWLDAVLQDIADKRPFAVLGSKYKGHSWDNFKDKLSISLLEHINGNAIYNISHPLTKNIIGELTSEADTLFNAIPFDYRISQMVTEGRLGIPPEFPFPEIKDLSGKWSITLPAKTNKFKSWWNKFGGEGELNPMKESNVILNFAATNYLPEHVGSQPIVHGKGAFAPWDSRLHQITLVVTDWNEDFARTLLSTLDSSDHPFAEVIVMREPPSSKPFAEKSFWARLWDAVAHPVSKKIPIRYHIREESSDYLDLCNAPVDTEWFMHTNAYHKVHEDVDLLFTHDDPPKPLLPYTPASSKHCTDYAACRETFALAKEFSPELDKVVLDLDMLFHTPSRNAFCNAWKEENGNLGEVLSMRVGGIEAYIQNDIPRGPTATSYLAYLYSSGMADNIYDFTNRLDHGAKDAFVKVHGKEEAERHPAENEAYWISRVLSESSANNRFFSSLWSRVFGRGVTNVSGPNVQYESAPIQEETVSATRPSFIQRFKSAFSKSWWSKGDVSESTEHQVEVSTQQEAAHSTSNKPSFIQRFRNVVSKHWGWSKSEDSEGKAQPEKEEDSEGKAQFENKEEEGGREERESEGTVKAAGEEQQNGKERTATAAAASRNAKKVSDDDCARSGAEARVCTEGNRGNLLEVCCTGLVCAGDGSGTCVVLGTYGGGDATRGLSLAPPGLLVHD